MNARKELAIQALQNMKGHDTYRARSAFRGMNADPMKEQHGMSGKTRAQILAEYEVHDAQIEAAIAWVRSA